MQSKSYLPVTIAVVLAALASFGAAVVAVNRIEQSARFDITAALAADEQDWADVTVDGLRVVMTGEAPDEAARFKAISVAGSVVDATRVIDQMTVAESGVIEPPRFAIEILRNLDGVSLIGLIPEGTDRQAFVDDLKAISDGAPVTDLLESADFPVPEGWRAALEFSLLALDELPRSKVSVAAGEVAVTAIADSVDSQRTIETTLTRAAPDDLRLVLDISAPRPVITPFTLRFLIDGDGARFDACSADTEAARTAILAAAREAGLSGKADCTIGLGTPSVKWAEAAIAGIETLRLLGGGKLTISDTDVSLVALDTVAQPVYDREIGELERALPEAFSLTALKPEPVVLDGTGGEAVEGPPEFVATRSPEGNVQLRGRLTDERSRRAVESYSHARFGLDRTYAAARLDPDLPKGWSLRVLAGLEALSYLNNGAVVVQPEFLSVRGDTGRPDAASEISRVLSDRLGEGQDFSIDVTYKEELDPIAALPTPEECVARINAVLADRKITFAPSSSDIDVEALDTIDNVATVLRECQNVPMEIGGHTDSQGRESMNLRLSQERANAVLNAIMSRRVLTSELRARGYGESQPIADNDTEEGREENRRIEFRLYDPDAPEPDDAGGEAAETSENGAEDEQN